MRVLLAGATGALGRRLVPMLVRAGHDVTGTTRTTSKLAELTAAGAEPVLMDGLDPRSVTDAVSGAQPDVIIHQLTALAGMGNPKKFDQEFEQTNRLRTAGTDHLLAAARANGVKHIVVQSFTGWPNERTGSRVKTEADPLDPRPAAGSAQTLAAIGYAEKAVAEAADLDGLVLRYGSFYGPGTGSAAGGDLLAMVHKRKLPVVGGGAGVWSFVHIDDAAGATLCAVERGEAGIYNIVDDEPAEVSEWLPYLAATVGARAPLRLPGWVARPMLGAHGMSLMTQVRGSSNVKAKRELSWELTFPTWREGFRSGLG